MFIKMWKGETNLQQKSQVLHDDIGVIVCLEEPVGVVTVMLVDVRECSTRFAPQIIVTFRHVEPDSRQLSVSLRAHEQQYVTSWAPRRFHMLCLGTNCLRTSHHPAQYTNSPMQAAG